MVELTHLKTELTWEGCAGVDKVEHQQEQFRGAKQISDAMQEALSQFIAEINDRFGGDGSTNKQRMVIDHYRDAFRNREEVVAAAPVNESFADFIKVVFNPIFLDTIVTQINANEGMFKLDISDDKMRVLFHTYVARCLWNDTRLESDFTKKES